jgi:hypothetical protein
MANKPKKKRNKQYRGVDAAIDRPVVTRISAVNRSRIGQWWFDHKRIARPVIIAVVVIAILTWLIIELFRIASNA